MLLLDTLWVEQDERQRTEHAFLLLTVVSSGLEIVIDEVALAKHAVAKCLGDLLYPWLAAFDHIVIGLQRPLATLL